MNYLKKLRKIANHKIYSKKKVMKGLKKTAVFVAGDHHIFFPALVALTSIEKHNPGLFDLYLCFNGKLLSSAMKSCLKKYGIGFIDAKSLPQYKRALSMGQMKEKRWPPEVYFNWCLPEHFDDLGYANSLKIDYDVLCTGDLSGLTELLKHDGFCSMLTTRVDPHIPQEALDLFAEKTGLCKPRKFSINSGVVYFSNQYCKNIGFFNVLCDALDALFAKCPKLRTVEQAALALIVSNFEADFVPLSKEYHQRSIVKLSCKTLKPNFKLVHYLTKYKPWLPFSMEDFEELALKNQSILPFMRNIWFEHAKTIDGFSSFTKEKPFSNSQLIGLANAATMQGQGKVNNISSTMVRDLIVQRRRDLSDTISKELNWTVAYGPFKGLRLSEKTWWSRPSRASMFLGLYESEVLHSLMKKPSRCKNFIDIGAADGYYAVGALKSGEFEKSFCFEISKKGQGAILENASLNGLERDVTVLGEANKISISQIPEYIIENSLVMVDIEGAEFDLINEDFLQKFRSSIVMIELHEWMVVDGSEKLAALLKLANKTHNITELKTGARDLSNFNELKMLSDTDRWLICSEGRARLMTWLRLDPKI